MTQDDAIAHGAAIARRRRPLVSADLENGFADDPAGVAETIRLAVETGLAGGSVEDYTPLDGGSIYDIGLARERVAAAAEAAHAGPVHFVLTARAENYIRGRQDLPDTIARLQAYQEAGADVLYAPGLSAIEDIRAVVTSVDLPVNVLALPGAPTVDELAEVGVGRISVGGAFALVALGAVVEAARELKRQGTYGFRNQAAPEAKAGGAASPSADAFVNAFPHAASPGGAWARLYLGCRGSSGERRPVCPCPPPGPSWPGS